MAGPELLLVSAGLQAFQGFQAYQQGKAQAKAYRQTAEYNAAVVGQQGEIEKQRLQKQQRLFAASQRVRGAASGATLDSFDTLFEDTQSQSLLDVALLDYDTKLRKDQIIYQGNVDAYGARASGRQGLISGLSGAAKSGVGYYNASNPSQTIYWNQGGTSTYRGAY